MKTRLSIPAAALLLSLLDPGGSARADENFRCGNYIASSDMSVQELLSKCGQPNSRSRSAEDVMVRNPNTGLMQKTGKTFTETWIYERGANPPMIVTIVDGRIRSIERGR
jgi:hypothetical protein